MRRTAVLTVFLASALWGVFVGLAPAAGAAGTITVPPTVNATTWTLAPSRRSGSGRQRHLARGVVHHVDLLRGDWADRGAATGSLIEQWNGTDVVRRSPTRPRPVAVALTACPASGTGFCAAVGAWSGECSRRGAVERHGLVAGHPDVPPSSTRRRSSTASPASSSTNCVAVGSETSTTAASRPAGRAVERNGVDDRDRPRRRRERVASALEGVSCCGAAFCVAIGQNQTGTVTSTLVELWNGSAWSIVTSPNGSTATGATNHLASVSVRRHVLLSGGRELQRRGEPGADVRRTVERFDVGAVVSTPNVSATEADQLPVSTCFSPTTCSAVGQSEDPTVGSSVPWPRSGTAPRGPAASAPSARVGDACRPRRTACRA